MYLVFFLLIFAPYIYTDNLSSSCNQDNKFSSSKSVNKMKFHYCLVISIFLIVLLTLRHDFVGTDTPGYRWIYAYLGKVDIPTSLSYIDGGFALLNKMLSYFSFDFRFLLFIQAIFYIGTISFIIVKYSRTPALSYFIFMTFGYFIFATTMRQAIAQSFTMLAFHQIKKKNIKLFVLFVITASLFHMSALIFLPAYWFDKFEFNKKTIALIISLILLIYAFREVIGMFIISLNKNEYDITQTGGYLLLLFYFTLLALGLIYNKVFIINNTNNKILYYFMAASLALIPISKMNPAFFRITNYYSIFIILYIPSLISCIKDKAIKSITFVFIIALGFFYFYYKIPSYGIRMHPYIFYWTEYPNELIPPEFFYSNWIMFN